MRAWITSPRADKDLLMLCASLRRSPWASLLATLSLPARSTSQSLLFVHSPVIVFSPLTITHNMLFHDRKPQYILNELNRATRRTNHDKEGMQSTSRERDKPMGSAAVIVRTGRTNCPGAAACLEDVPHLFHAGYFGFH